MKEIVKKYWYVGAIGIILIIAIIALDMGKGSNNQNGQTVNTIKTQPTVAPNTSPGAAAVGYGPNPTGIPKTVIDQQNQMLDQNKKDYPLADILPYKTAVFTIDHYRYPRELIVYIKRDEDRVIAADLIGKWLKDNGFSPSSHTVTWEVVK